MQACVICFFFFHFRIYYRKAYSQGQFGGDIMPAVLAQFIIMMHSLGKLFSKMYSFHYSRERKKEILSKLVIKKGGL